MKIELDTTARTLNITHDSGTRESLDLYSRRGFELLSDAWLKVGWNQKYTYTFAWMGRPIIQLPDDMIRTQEIVYRVKPTLIIETGIAHGGSLVYSASLLKLLGGGRVVGVDIDIRPHNRAAIEAHELSPMITMIQGSSVDQAIVDKVKTHIRPDDRVLIFLDSNHSYDHVLAELKAYAKFVTPGSYIVATDGCMQEVSDTPRGKPEWTRDNPQQAARDFVAANKNFVIEQPAWPFNESDLQRSITHWPGAWIRKVAP
jgi:cephalosporin hydroxylase